MLNTAAVLAEAGHVELPMPAYMYGVVALVIFLVLMVVTLSYRDVANRHKAKADAYAAAHGDEHAAGGHGGH
ncbi:hypothetical protein [Agromyces seonyuensis]|uniref:4-hydroxybenzoate polyprenyltransferase n=1 Tax=Agromyces seonyuensis TaxID=2662446 RepID=A0A6I4P3M0_9MICO|nr:hypothetical protein [Agromyces seonyuensis]MWC00313.1 hypothetical protein [Agromyces seonyuensis]